jgi:hypothetical protein
MYMTGATVDKFILIVQCSELLKLQSTDGQKDHLRELGVKGRIILNKS